MSVIFIVMAIFLGIYGISLYNKLISLRNGVQNSFSQIDVQLKRRYDLIPNLVEATKASLEHEKGTLQKVIEARNQMQAIHGEAAKHPTNPQSLNQLMQADAQLTSALERLMAVVEAYPDLKAQSTVHSLMEELSSTENRIGFARQGFNDTTTDYNTLCESFPALILARQFGFAPSALWKIEKAEEKDPVRINLRST